MGYRDKVYFYYYLRIYYVPMCGVTLISIISHHSGLYPQICLAMEHGSKLTMFVGLAVIMTLDLLKIRIKKHYIKISAIRSWNWLRLLSQKKKKNKQNTSIEKVALSIVPFIGIWEGWSRHLKVVGSVDLNCYALVFYTVGIWAIRRMWKYSLVILLAFHFYIRNLKGNTWVRVAVQKILTMKERSYWWDGTKNGKMKEKGEVVKRRSYIGRNWAWNTRQWKREKWWK